MSRTAGSAGRPAGPPDPPARSGGCGRSRGGGRETPVRWSTTDDALSGPGPLARFGSLALGEITDHVLLYERRHQATVLGEHVGAAVRPPPPGMRALLREQQPRSRV